MRIDDAIFHKLSEENEYNVHSQSGFSHYCDMFVKYLSVSEQNSENRVNNNCKMQHETRICGRRAIPFSIHRQTRYKRKEIKLNCGTSEQRDCYALQFLQYTPILHLDLGSATRMTKTRNK